MGRGEKSLRRCDSESELRLGGREKKKGEDIKKRDGGNKNTPEYVLYDKNQTCFVIGAVTVYYRLPIRLQR